ncbi:MAG: glycosyltransferase [Desulfobacterium sp.]|nr:glycosyltransferase [Desulfobacterium sp.]
MYVTIAICTYNRANLLAQTLESFINIKIPENIEYHFLIINNNSSDNTEEIIKTYSKKLPLETYSETKPGSANARNAVLEYARGDYVLCTDDDVQVDKNFLLSFVDCVKKYPDHVVFSGLIEPWFEVVPDPDLARAFPLLSTGFTPQDINIQPGPCFKDVIVYGVNMGFNLSAAEGVKYDTNLGVSGKNFGCMEDSDFVDRVNKKNRSKSVWCPDMKIKHFIPVERTTKKYLTKLYTDRTASLFRKKGLPDGRKIFGFPIWALRSLVVNYSKYVLYNVSFSKYKSLYHLAEYSKALGVLKSTNDPNY